MSVRRVDSVLLSWCCCCAACVPVWVKLRCCWKNGQCGVGGQPGRDRSGASVAVFVAHLHRPADTTHRAVLKNLIYQLDAALESYDTQRNGLVFIYDMTGSKYSNFDYDLSIKILSLLKGAYPARLKRVLIVAAPLWFKAPFNVLRLFIKEKLRERVYTLSRAELLQFVPWEVLPLSLGGQQAPVHNLWLSFCEQVAYKLSPEIDSYFVAPGKSGDSSMSASSTRSVLSDQELLVGDPEMENPNSTDMRDQEHNRSERTAAAKRHSLSAVDADASVSGLSRRWSDTRKRNLNCVPSTDRSDGFPQKKRSLSSVTSVPVDAIHMPENSGFDIDQFVQHVNYMRRRGLNSEYSTIRAEPPAGTFVVCKARHNSSKNRYTDVLCFDHSRIILPVTNDDHTSDYINANIMDGYMQTNAYISTQGPLPETFADFWRMVWHHQCLVVVMLTRTEERGRLKCGHYWPACDSTQEQYGEFVVRNNSVHRLENYTETKLTVCNTDMGESRSVVHLQFTNWPDYGVPCADSFLDFLFYVREAQDGATEQLGPSGSADPGGPPVVVHCSAGIGRTGTFISVDICLRRLDSTGRVDITSTVRGVRSQRAFSIQVPDQYVFCHLAVVQHAVRFGLVTGLEPLRLDDMGDSSD